MLPQTRLFRTILCPIDFSEHSRHALRYAALLAARYRSRLVAIFIEDPMLAAAAAFALDEKTLLDEGRIQLQRFVEQAASAHGITGKATTIEVTVGKPHEEILRASKRFKCDLIVMYFDGLNRSKPNDVRIHDAPRAARIVTTNSRYATCRYAFIRYFAELARQKGDCTNRSRTSRSSRCTRGRISRSRTRRAAAARSTSWSLFPTSRGSSSTKHGGTLSATGRRWPS